MDFKVSGSAVGLAYADVAHLEIKLETAVAELHHAQLGGGVEPQEVALVKLDLDARRTAGLDRVSGTRVRRLPAARSRRRALST